RVPDMKIAIGLGREARVHAPAVFPRAEVFLNDLRDEISWLAGRGVGAGAVGRRTIVLGWIAIHVFSFPLSSSSLGITSLEIVPSSGPDAGDASTPPRDRRMRRESGWPRLERISARRGRGREACPLGGRRSWCPRSRALSIL